MLRPGEEVAVTCVVVMEMSVDNHLYLIGTYAVDSKTFFHEPLPRLGREAPPCLPVHNKPVVDSAVDEYRPFSLAKQKTEVRVRQITFLQSGEYKL